MRVVGYLRVSTEGQARDGVSLDAQREKVRGYAALHEVDLIEVVADAGASAKSIDRPGLGRVLAMLDARQAQGLVVYKLDRLTRSLADWSALIDRYFGESGGRSLMSVSESIDTRTASGRMVLNVMMTVAQWEREQVVERTRAAVRYKQSRGERVSGLLPFGSRAAADGRLLEDDPAELAVVEVIRRHRAEGLNPRRIAAELDAAGIASRTGRPWAHSTVRAILRRLGPSPR